MPDPLQTHLEHQGISPLEAQAQARGLRAEFEMRVEALEGHLKTASSVEDLQTMLEEHRCVLERASQARAGNFKPKLACKAGCTPCCFLRVKTSVPEILTLAAHIESLPQKRRDTLERRVYRAAKQAKIMNHETWNTRGPGCPLLEDGKCSVYESRPLACRAHHSLELKACQKLHSRGTGAVPVDSHLELMGMQFVGALKEAAQRRNLQSDALELTTALSAALLEKNALERWLKGEKVFAKADELENTRNL